MAGIGKGTGGLIKGFLSGAVTSTAALVGTASKGVAKGECGMDRDKLDDNERK